MLWGRPCCDGPRHGWAVTFPDSNGSHNIYSPLKAQPPRQKNETDKESSDSDTGSPMRQEMQMNDWHGIECEEDVKHVITQSDEENDYDSDATTPIED